ncbi:MAG: hypothetical protein INR64_11195 [Caulobacteraceae bacterium]|nr:hypothetical protein [Caulobacter sp.]
MPGLSSLFSGLRSRQADARELEPLHGRPKRTILIQNYHTPASKALARDFKKIGFAVYSPDSDWGSISYYHDNSELGGKLVSKKDYFSLDPGYVLITCKPHELDMRVIAHAHNDKLILNIAEHDFTYQSGLGDIMICPDIRTFENYPAKLKHKLLYFPRPDLSQELSKDVAAAFASRRACSYISFPAQWPQGTAAFQRFKALYKGEFRAHGLEAPDGPLLHAHANQLMSSSFVTVHFKDKEAYGLSCLESMMLGTPIVSLNSFMHDKTLGRFFLTPANSILTDTVDEAVERLETLSLQDYAAMSAAARERVMELTSDARTVERLDAAISEYSPR